MVILRVAHPSSSKPELSGISFHTDILTGQMFYFLPHDEVIGKSVVEGQIIGIAQDLKKYYGEGMTNHVHLEIESIDPLFLINIKEALKKI